MSDDDRGDWLLEVKRDKRLDRRLDFEQRHRLETEVLPAVIGDPEYAAATIVRLEAERDRLREALDFISEEHDAGRHDGLPEPCPAHDAETIFAVARAALDKQ